MAPTKGSRDITCSRRNKPSIGMLTLVSIAISADIKNLPKCPSFINWEIILSSTKRPQGAIKDHGLLLIFLGAGYSMVTY